MIKKYVNKILKLFAIFGLTLFLLSPKEINPSEDFERYAAHQWRRLRVINIETYKLEHSLNALYETFILKGRGYEKHKDLFKRSSS